MNFRRHRPRHKGAAAREHSSDWRYIQLEKGDRQRSRAGVRKWIEATVQAMRDWRAPERDS